MVEIKRGYKMTYTEELLDGCLYFTSNRFARLLTKMAEEEFEATTLSPTHAFLLLAIIERPGITQKEAGNILHMTPSTITRFLDKLVTKGYVVRSAQGRSSLLHPTPEGITLEPSIKAAWARLHQRYSTKIDASLCTALGAQLVEVCQKCNQE